MNITSTEYTSRPDCRFPLSFCLCIFINTQPLKRKRADRLLILRALILIPCELSPVIPYKLQHIAQTLVSQQKNSKILPGRSSLLYCVETLLCVPYKPQHCASFGKFQNPSLQGVCGKRFSPHTSKPVVVQLHLYTLYTRIVLGPTS